MIKALIVISIIQFAVIMMLFGKLSDIENSLDRPAAPPAVGTNASPFRQNPVQAGTGIQEERLRAIIREELGAELAELSNGERAVAVSPALPPQDRMPAEQEQVLQQIEFFSSVGRISTSEMQKLQMDIAKLDPASRTAALQELNRALNSGRLEGRL